MRKLLSWTILVAFLIIVSSPHVVSGARKGQPPGQTSQEPTEGPKAFLPEISWDFGKIPKDAVVSHSFWIKNVGTDTLKIISVRPG